MIANALDFIKLGSSDKCVPSHRGEDKDELIRKFF